MTEIASPEQPSHRSLRRVRHTFYTTQTNKPRTRETLIHPYKLNCHSRWMPPVPKQETPHLPGKRLRSVVTVNVFFALLLLLSLTGSASVAPKHGLHDGATASTLIFRQFSEQNHLFSSSTINGNVSSESLIMADLWSRCYLREKFAVGFEQIGLSWLESWRGKRELHQISKEAFSPFPSTLRHLCFAVFRRISALTEH